MGLLRATELASELGVSKARISQYVSEGKLDGCFHGEGRGRRFDLGKVSEALGRRLDPGQMLGNGSRTRQTLQGLMSAPRPTDTSETEDEDDDAPAPLTLRPDTLLPANDTARYELARTLKAEEEARRLRRQNAEAEGEYVLASEVARQTARLMAQEIAEFQSVLRDAARRIADHMGVDFKEVRKHLMDELRSHRADRADRLARSAESEPMTPAEKDGNI